MPDGALVKVVVRLEADPGGEYEHGWAQEEMLWAEPLGGGLFKLRSIPWETDALHFADVVSGRLRTGDVWEVLHLDSPSGHSTLRLAFSADAPSDQKDSVLARLERLVGVAEHIAGDHWAVDVNPGSDIREALALLARSENAGVISRSAHT